MISPLREDAPLSRAAYASRESAPGQTADGFHLAQQPVEQAADHPDLRARLERLPTFTARALSASLTPVSEASVTRA
jgi:hypothetical protein